MDRREDILNACLTLLAERGIQGLSQPQVAAAAGLKQGHLTYYFPTRADLLRAVAEALTGKGLAPLEGAGREGVLDSGRLIRGLAIQVCERKNARFMFALLSMAEEDEHVRTLVDEFERQLIASLDTLLVAARCNRRINGESLHAILLGLTVQGMATNRRDMPALAQRVLRQALAPADKPDSRGKR